MAPSILTSWKSYINLRKYLNFQHIACNGQYVYNDIACLQEIVTKYFSVKHILQHLRSRNYFGFGGWRYF